VGLHDPSSLLDERSVQKAHQGRDSAKDVQQLGIETVVSRERRLELPPGKKLLEAQVVCGGMHFEVTPGHRRQLFTVEGADGLAEHGAVHDSAETFVVGRDVLSNQPKIR